MTAGRHVIVGVGNAFRGDDGVALAVVDRLRTRAPDEVELVVCEQEPTRLLDSWQGAESVTIVDAVASGGEPGTLYRYDATDEPIPSRVFRSSTHAFGVGDAIELARAVDKLPARVVVYGIEGQAFESGDELSAAVAAAVEPAADAVLAEIEQLTAKGSTCTSER
jgi:hydrogenase maturation protease